MQLLRVRPIPPVLLRLLWMPLLAFALLTAEEAIASDRTVTVQPDAGVRFFNSDVGLGSSASVGIRMDLAVADRLSFGIDYLFSSPTRTNTERLANVDALRALARFELLGGSTRPFVDVGIGGLRFNFTDAVDYSASAGTLGIGIMRRLGAHHSISLEGSGDLYETRAETYDTFGRLIRLGPARWNRLANLSAGIGYRF